MSWITWGKRNERKEYVETVNEEKQPEQKKRIDPLDAVDTSHVYHVVKRQLLPDSWFEFEPIAMDVKYHPATGSAELTIQGESITLNKEEFEDLRRVLHAFAHDPKFNEGAEELVVSAPEGTTIHYHLNLKEEGSK